LSHFKKLILPLAAALVLQASFAMADAPPRIIRDDEIESNLRVMSTMVFEEAGLSPTTVRFALIDNNELNAFVAGGQNIFLHTGLILETDNPEELIGVIAHETGHISAGHLFRAREEIENTSMQAMLANILGFAAAIGTKSPGVGMAIGSAGQSVAMRSMLRHNRIQETAADQAGVRFLKGAGLPLSGFTSFMEKLSSQELLPDTQQSEYVRTHPLSMDRVDFLKNTALSAPKGSVPAVYIKMHARIKAKLLGYLFPDRALQDRSDSAESRYGRAIAYYRKTEMAKSLSLLDPLIAEEPKNPYFYELKAQMLFENGKIEQATAVYRKAVEFAPRSGLIRAAYGHALLELKTPDINTAIEQLTRAIQLEPRQSETHHFLAIAYGKKGQTGLFHLHLAEAALLRGNLGTAKKEAKMAKDALPKGSTGILRADDILAVAAKKDKNKGKEKD
jgi:predicted Zn-dependent protease